MKHKNHTVNVYVYNPENLKEVLDKVEFNVKYIPTNKWNRFLIVVNEVFTGVEIILTTLDHGGNKKSVRKHIAEAIYNYNEGIDLPYQNRVKMNYPNLQTAKLAENIFDKKILNMGDFKKRDELRKYNLM